MSYQAIKDLVGYALRTGLIDEYDRPWAVNELLKAMGMDAWEEPAETHERPLEDILKDPAASLPSARATAQGPSVFSRSGAAHIPRLTHPFSFHSLL